MSTCLSRDSAIREPWRTCEEIRESHALCREQRVSISWLFYAMMPGRKAALAASGEEECKFGACPACRFGIFLLATGTCQIEKKRVSKACPDFVFRTVFGRCAVDVSKFCGEKNCFFSRMIFHSPEIDACFCLKKQNNGLEV